MDELRTLINSYERQIIDLANPALVGKDVPTKDWAFAHLFDALAAVVVYLVFVVVGTAVMKVSECGLSSRRASAAVLTHPRSHPTGPLPAEEGQRRSARGKGWQG